LLVSSLMPGPDWLYLATAILIGLLSLLLLFWSLLSDRARGRRRCPKCWYDMTGVPGLKCSECGAAARSDGALRRTRRRWGLAALAMLGCGLALSAAMTPRVRRDGIWKSLPTTVLLTIQNCIGLGVQPELDREITRRVPAEFVHMWEWERHQAVRCLASASLPVESTSGNVQVPSGGSCITVMPLRDAHYLLIDIGPNQGPRVNLPAVVDGSGPKGDIIVRLAARVERGGTGLGPGRDPEWKALVNYPVRVKPPAAAAASTSP
jgi:hypothetical protein